jgi:hypothetical protein
MSSSKNKNLIIFGTVTAVAGVWLLLYQFQNSASQTEQDEKSQNKTIQDGRTPVVNNNSESKVEIAKREEQPTKLPEGQESQNNGTQNHGEDITARSCSLTDSLMEQAANADPKSAEQNRQIAAQKEQFADNQEWAAAMTKKKEEKAEQQANDSNLQAKNKEAEASALRAYQLAEEKAMIDLALAEENKKIAEPQKQIELQSQGASPSEPQIDENHEPASMPLSKNQNRRRNKNKKKGTADAPAIGTNGATSPTDVAAILKAKTKAGKTSKKKNHQGSAAAAAVKEIQNHQAGTKKKKVKSKTQE